MAITREFYDIKFELEEKVVNKFYDIQAKMSRGERFNNDLSNGAVEWQEFTEKFFQEQSLSYPNIFRAKEDLKKLQIRVYGGGIKKHKTSIISCFGYYLEQWEFFFSMGFVGDFESVNFTNANFHSHVSFQHMRVSGLSCFDEVEFIETADFNHARFSDKVSFVNAIFRDSVRFNQVSFADYADFSNVIFEKNVEFNNLLKKYKSLFVMSNATFKGRIEWSPLKGELPNFANSHFPNGKNIIIKESIEVVLEKIFNLFGNQGFSIEKPLALLIMSMMFFYCIFLAFGVGQSFQEAFNRTIFPLADLDSKLVPKFFLTIQSAINAVFLFLLFLGIRNKFKIK